MYNNILFDLDGTLTDSKEGIINSVKYALEIFPQVDFDDLEQFLGPPLMYSFQEFCGLNEADAALATERYRERFVPIGMFENKPFDGIIDLLKELKVAGKTIALATSKPEEYAKKICDRYNISPYIDVLTGASMDGSYPDTKIDVIKECLTRLHLPIHAPKHTVMIGDRHYDIKGAASFTMDSIGADWGYAKGSELMDAGATYVCDTVTDLKHLLLS